MARKRSASTAFGAPSSGLGTGDFATNYTSQGRAIRKCRTRTRKVQSTPDGSEDEAEERPSEDNYDDDMSDGITVAPSRKKHKLTTRAPSLSPTRELPGNDDLEVETGLTSDEETAESQTQTQRRESDGHVTVHLTINIPLNHQGLITLNLDPKTSRSTSSDKFNELARAHSDAGSKPKPKVKWAGLLDLPAELKNIIYREVFVAEKPFSFGAPKNFNRSSALLRTCKQVHEEGRSILYSENSFMVERRSQIYGSLWSTQWQEIGYLAVRKFMKSIGPINTALIRNITFFLEDAVPCLNPSLTSNADRRFSNDDELLSILRHLARHSQLQTMKLHFAGRRRVERGDDRFLDYMRRIRADKVEFIKNPRSIYDRESKQEEGVEKSLLATCTRKHKKFDH